MITDFNKNKILGLGGRCCIFRRLKSKQFSFVYSTIVNSTIIKNNEIKDDKNKTFEIINSIKDTKNFETAFIHKSVRLANLDNKSYERLEFLGDSLLEYYTTNFLFNSLPNHSEGDLTQLRSLIVERKNISKLSKELGLDVYLKTGAGVEKTTKILADIFEPFVAALWLEKGENEKKNFFFF